MLRNDSAASLRLDRSCRPTSLFLWAPSMRWPMMAFRRMHHLMGYGALQYAFRPASCARYIPLRTDPVQDRASSNVAYAGANYCAAIFLLFFPPIYRSGAQS